MESVKKFIRDIPDFPKKGIVFKDITPLLANASAFTKTINTLKERFSEKRSTGLWELKLAGSSSPRPWHMH